MQKQWHGTPQPHALPNYKRQSVQILSPAIYFDPEQYRNLLTYNCLCVHSRHYAKLLTIYDHLPNCFFALIDHEFIKGIISFKFIF